MISRYILFFLLLCLLQLTAACSVMRYYHIGMSCSACHEGKPERGKAALMQPENPSKRCRDCHRYNNEGDHHPSSLISGPTGDTAIIDPDFKLYSGNMECLTCHQIHTGEDYGLGTRNFLVGAPYADRRDICFRCHQKAVYKDINPHGDMLEENGDLKQSTCLVCHAEVPDPKVDRTGDVKFRAAVSFLCWRCHPLMAQDFMDKHYLKKPSARRSVEMRWSEEDHDIILPLDSTRRITCSTCHNPHQAGVVIDERAKKGAGAKKRLRSDKICEKCHRGKM
ncbi:MAG: cytochrome c3 family protein [bacterium]|nr:cytochrome c3 family protein [bacterium]